MLFYVRDRKNVATKNHVNALQKENMVMNAIGNAAYSKLNLELKEKIQNGSNEKKVNGSAALSERDGLVTSLPKETPSEKLSSNINGKSTVEHNYLVGNAKSELLMLPPTNAPLKENSSFELNSITNGSGDTSNSGHVVMNGTCHNKINIIEEQNASTIVLPDCSRPQDSLHKKESSNEEKPSESAKKAPNSDVLSRLSGDQCKMDGPISETVFCSYIVC